MKRSTDRILTTHAGSLPRPEGLREIVAAKSTGQAVDEEDLNRRIRTGVAEVVQLQIQSGIDIVNDGELSKTSFTDYIHSRISGFEERQMPPEEIPAQDIAGPTCWNFPNISPPGSRWAPGVIRSFAPGLSDIPGRRRYKPTSMPSKPLCRTRKWRRLSCLRWRRAPPSH